VEKSEKSLGSCFMGPRSMCLWVELCVRVIGQTDRQRGRWTDK